MTLQKKLAEYKKYFWKGGHFTSKNGDFAFAARMRLAENAQINLKTKCIEWTGSKEYYGHGCTTINGLRLKTHRLAAFIFLGLPIKNPKTCACHHCDNPPCFTPHHLFVGTQADNVADRHVKGKSPGRPQPGEKNGWAKLTDREALKILKIHPIRGLAPKLAKKFGVHRITISRIWQRKTFKHLLPVTG